MIATFPFIVNDIPDPWVRDEAVALAEKVKSVQELPLVFKVKVALVLTTILPKIVADDPPIVLAAPDKFTVP